MKTSRGIRLLTSAVVLACATFSSAACGGSDSGPSVDQVHQVAEKLVGAPGGACPLGLDPQAALKSASITAAVAPGTPPADVDLDRLANPEAVLARAGGAMITCHYVVGSGGRLDVAFLAVRTGQARTVLAPVIQRDGELAKADLDTLFGEQFGVGTTLITPAGGKAALAHVKVSGGDAVLEVASPDGSIPAGEPLLKMTETLASQLKF